ncbi:MAG: TonB-dependent receptor [Bacteroidales bacterium]|nr:TonB-dependent receptor [Bacteroidales bacterium]
MKTIGILTLFLFTTMLAVSQRYTISGYISDVKTGEKLIAASVYDTISKKGAITNNYGFYSLTLPEGKVALIVSYVGYSLKTDVFELKSNIVKNIMLNPTIELKEVEIVAERAKHVESSQMSMTQIPIQTIKSLPVFFSEADILKTIQLLPGVQSGGEGTSGLYVRGGGPDQNLILLDGVPVYNCDHLFGFFSVFNSDAIQNVTLIKGGFPARYGGRLSSVLDIRMKEGNLNEYHGTFSIGLISSKFMMEGPLIKKKSSFVVSARRTYIDILAQPIIRSAGDGTSGGYYFYDVNTKLNYIFSDTNRLFLSIYLGNDKAYSKIKDQYNDNGINYENKEKASLSWGNIITALRWNHLFTPKLFSNVTATFSRYRFQVGMESNTQQNNNGSISKSSFAYKYFSGIYDFAGKIDFDYHPSPNHNIIFGASEIYHTFSPGVNVFKGEENNDPTTKIDTSFGNSNIFAHEIALFIEDDITINALLKANIGIHQSMFLVRNKFYSNTQPRLSLRYLMHEKWSLKAAYSQMNQYINLLSNSGIGLPTDLWLPSTNRIKPQASQQWALGIFNVPAKGFEASIEGYYKTMKNLIEYKEGATFFSEGESWEDKIEMGNGWAYGAEFFFKKNKGKTTGWIGYTLAWSWRKFEKLNFGKSFPYRYDRRHDISIAITHFINEKIDIGVVWVYGTGNAVSLPIEQYPMLEFPSMPQNGYYYEPNMVEYYDGRNGFRMPPYHRLDLSFNMHKKLKRAERTWSIGIYNVYNRKNPYYLYFSYDEQGNKRLTQISLFPIIPSFSYNLTF